MKTTNNSIVCSINKSNDLRLQKSKSQTPKFVNEITKNISFKQALKVLEDRNKSFEENLNKLNQISKEIKQNLTNSTNSNNILKLDPIKSKQIEELAISSSRLLTSSRGDVL